jgi:hypothetical protein
MLAPDPVPEIMFCDPKTSNFCDKKAIFMVPYGTEGVGGGGLH